MRKFNSLKNGQSRIEKIVPNNVNIENSRHGRIYWIKSVRVCVYFRKAKKETIVHWSMGMGDGIE